MSEEVLKELLEELRKVASEGMPKEGHPLTSLHHKAKRMYELSTRALEIVNELINDVKVKIKARTQELTLRYGPGYVTIKTVRNRQGRKYRYIIYRVLRPKRKDIYLSNEPLPKLRRKLRELHETKEKLKAIRRMAWVYMKSTEDYA